MSYDTTASTATSEGGRRLFIVEEVDVRKLFTRLTQVSQDGIDSGHECDDLGQHSTRGSLSSERSDIPHLCHSKSFLEAIEDSSDSTTADEKVNDAMPGSEMSSIDDILAHSVSSYDTPTSFLPFKGRMTTGTLGYSLRPSLWRGHRSFLEFDKDLDDEADSESECECRGQVRNISSRSRSRVLRGAPPGYQHNPANQKSQKLPPEETTASFCGSSTDEPDLEISSLRLDGNDSLAGDRSS